jgi:hypothetical protein
VGIRTTPVGSQELSVYGPISTFKYLTGRDSAEFCFWGADPRILGKNRIIFYKHDQSGYIDVECKTLYEYSDVTQKENITKLSSSLDKVKALEGVEYNWKSDPDKINQIGLIAQDVQKVIPEVVSVNDSTGGLTLSYTHLVPLLIEAIKEQQAQIELLETELISQKSAVMDEGIVNELAISNTFEQNNPNPFSENTIIKYQVSNNVNNAMMYIFDMNGKLIDNHVLYSGIGNELLIAGNTLEAGMYIYTMVCDGVEIGSKRMILTK